MFKASMDELMRVLRDFHNLTNFLITVFDAERNNVASYPNHMCEFCTEVSVYFSYGLHFLRIFATMSTAAMVFESMISPFIIISTNLSI